MLPLIRWLDHGRHDTAAGLVGGNVIYSLLVETRSGAGWPPVVVTWQRGGRIFGESLA